MRWTGDISNFNIQWEFKANQLAIYRSCLVMLWFRICYIIIIYVFCFVFCISAIPNPCNNSPCQNGGQCSRCDGSCYAYKCQCNPGYEGVNCEISKYDTLEVWIGRGGVQMFTSSSWLKSKVKKGRLISPVCYLLVIFFGKSANLGSKYTKTKQNSF